jgi:putative FmdB family regulatory protein
MPLYEFRCESCGHQIETILAFSDPLPTTCEACGGTLKKLLAAPAVQFKGSGFYLTDYGKSGSAGASGGKDKGESGAAKPAGDSKPSGDAAGGASGGAAPGGDAKPKG